MKFIGVFSAFLLLVMPWFALLTVFSRNKSFWKGSFILSIPTFIASLVMLTHLSGLFADKPLISSENAAESFLISVSRDGIIVYVYAVVFLLSFVFVLFYKKHCIK
jgi:hypothetical protein